MKVLVTGANGMLGQDLCPILQDRGWFVIPTDYNTLDVTDSNAVENKIKEVHPDLIIHCAAYTNVDKAESDYETAYKLNVEAVSNIAKAAAEIDAKMVYISTDYVFEGTKTTPYLPKDEPNPVNLYGKTKYLGELEVQKYSKKFYIVRTSWLYGIYGKNFVETMISLKDNKELKVVDDQVGSPTWTKELIEGIIKLLDMPYGIYHLSGKNETSWYNFAKTIFKLENLNVNLKPCTTDEFPRPAHRPKYSYMINDNNLTLLRDWKEALIDYLKERKMKQNG